MALFGLSGGPGEGGESGGNAERERIYKLIDDSDLNLEYKKQFHAAIKNRENDIQSFINSVVNYDPREGISQIKNVLLNAFWSNISEYIEGVITKQKNNEDIKHFVKYFVEDSNMYQLHLFSLFQPMLFNYFLKSNEGAQQNHDLTKKNLALETEVQRLKQQLALKDAQSNP